SVIICVSVGSVTDLFTSVHMFFFFSSRRRHTRSKRDWSSDVCSSDLPITPLLEELFPEVENYEDLTQEDLEYITEVYSFGVSIRSEERRVGKECRDRWAWFA